MSTVTSFGLVKPCIVDLYHHCLTTGYCNLLNAMTPQASPKPYNQRRLSYRPNLLNNCIILIHYRHNNFIHILYISLNFFNTMVSIILDRPIDYDFPTL